MATHEPSITPVTTGDAALSERSQTIAMIAEVMWNGAGAPTMTDEAYSAEYLTDAAQQYREFEAGTLEPWWQA